MTKIDRVRESRGKKERERGREDRREGERKRVKRKIASDRGRDR